MTTSLLDREIYSYPDIDRLVGLTAGTARRWLHGYQRSGTLYEPLLREAASQREVATWGEMVEARLVSEFRGKRVSLQSMRPAISRLREQFGPYPLAQAKPFLDVQGRELVLQVQGEVGLSTRLSIVVIRNGQTMLSEPTRRFQALVDYIDDEASVIRPSNITPQVSMRPGISFGQPTVRGVRTEIIAEGYRAGATREELANLRAQL